jgi:hypothetical protein
MPREFSEFWQGALVSEWLRMLRYLLSWSSWGPTHRSLNLPHYANYQLVIMLDSWKFCRHENQIHHGPELQFQLMSIIYQLINHSRLTTSFIRDLFFPIAVEVLPYYHLVNPASVAHMVEEINIRRIKNCRANRSLIDWWCCVACRPTLDALALMMLVWKWGTFR